MALEWMALEKGRPRRHLPVDLSLGIVISVCTFPSVGKAGFEVRSRGGRYLITRVIRTYGSLVEHTLEHVLQAGSALLARDVKVRHGILYEERGGQKRRWAQGGR